MRIAVGLSGGVDSSLAALLLKEDGHEVVGITAYFGERPSCERSRARSDPSAVAVAARASAEALGIPLDVVDLAELFEREVVSAATRAYASGRTPNPCVLCNSRVRFPALADAARRLGAEALATGHYARLQQRGDVSGGGSDRALSDLLRGVDPEHDQSYFLFAVRAADLAFCRFPLGGWRKADVARRMGELSHPSAERASSQDLCFAAGLSARELVEARLGEALPPGPIVDTSGKRLGTHRGLADFTVGQRKGIGVAGREPLYVICLRPESNEVVVGPARELDRTRFEIEELTWRDGPPSDPLRALVQIRYRTRPITGIVAPGDEGRAAVELDGPARAVAPGQAAVFYEGDRVLGGGWICA